MINILEETQKPKVIKDLVHILEESDFKVFGSCENKKYGSWEINADDFGLEFKIIGNEFHIIDFSVSLIKRGEGVGTFIIEKLFEVLKQNNFKKIIAQNVSLDARTFWKKLGF